MRIIVIGDRIVGTASARWPARDGHVVTVADRATERRWASIGGRMVGGRQSAVTATDFAL